MTARGLRVLAVADRDWPGATPDRDEAEGHGLTLLGLVGLLDPPRRECPPPSRPATPRESPCTW
jgi:magnesium-transporting ATPase (P-type)